MKKVWAHNLGNGEVTRIDAEIFKSVNWGDYHHHDYEGPFRTRKAALEDAVSRYQTDIAIAKERLKTAIRTARRYTK